MFFLEKYKMDLNDIKIYLWCWHLDITNAPISTNLFLDVCVCVCVCVYGTYYVILKWDHIALSVLQHFFI